MKQILSIGVYLLTNFYFIQLLDFLYKNRRLISFNAISSDQVRFLGSIQAQTRISLIILLLLWISGPLIARQKLSDRWVKVSVYLIAVASAFGALSILHSESQV